MKKVERALENESQWPFLRDANRQVVLVFKTDVITPKTPSVVSRVEGIFKWKDSPNQRVIHSVHRVPVSTIVLYNGAGLRIVYTYTQT